MDDITVPLYDRIDARLVLPDAALGGPVAVSEWRRRVFDPIRGTVGKPQDYKRTVRIGQVEYLGCWPHCYPSADAGLVTLVFDMARPVSAGPPACLHDRWYWVDQECHLVGCRACAKRGMWREGAVIDWVGDQRPAIAPKPGTWYRTRNGGYVHALAQEQEQRAFVQARRYTADGPPLTDQDVDGLYDQTTGAFGNDSEWECVARLTDVPEVVWRHALPAELRPNVKRKY